MKATRLGCKYLLRKEDIDELFSRSTEFRIQSKERAPITERYTVQEIQNNFDMTLAAIYTLASNNAMTTQIYAELVSEKKRESANKISLK